MKPGNRRGASGRWRAALDCGLIAGLAASCSGTTGGGKVCTASFASISAVAVDAAGQPATNLAIRDSVLRTGAAFDIEQSALPPVAGAITVFTDSHMGDVRKSGDSVRVIGNGAGKGFAAQYQFGTDGCHVRKITGPDTVVVR